MPKKPRSFLLFVISPFIFDLTLGDTFELNPNTVMWQLRAAALDRDFIVAQIKRHIIEILSLDSSDSRTKNLQNTEF